MLLCCRPIPLQSVFLVLYNGTSFVTKARYYLYEVVWSKGNVQNTQIWAQLNNLQWCWLKLSSGMPYWFGWMAVFLPKWIVLLRPDFPHFLADPTTSCRQYLSSKILAIRTHFAMVHNTILLISKYKLQKYMISKIFQTFCGNYSLHWLCPAAAMNPWT